MAEEKVKKKRYLPLLIILGGVGILALMAKGTPTITPACSKYNVSLKSIKKNNPTFFSGLSFCTVDAKMNGSIVGQVPNVAGNNLIINWSFNGVATGSKQYNAGDLVVGQLFPTDIQFSTNNDNVSIQFIENGMEVLSLEYEAGCAKVMEMGGFVI